MQATIISANPCRSLGSSPLVGANGDDGFTGSAYLFAYDGVTWSQQDKLAASDGAANAQFGSSVSLVGRRAVVGAGDAVINGGGSGAAYIFGGL